MKENESAERVNIVNKSMRLLAVQLLLCAAFAAVAYGYYCGCENGWARGLCRILRGPLYVAGTVLTAASFGSVSTSWIRAVDKGVISKRALRWPFLLSAVMAWLFLASMPYLEGRKAGAAASTAEVRR